MAGYGDLQKETETEKDSEDFLDQVNKLGAELVLLRKEVATLEAQTKDKNARIRHLSEVKIPTLLQERGMVAFTMNDGTSIALEEDIKCKIPTGMLDEAIDWLETNGHGGVVKRTIVIDFIKGEEKWANKFESDMKKRVKPLNHKRTKSVHAGTLKALVKECLKSGVDIPFKQFGIFRRNVIKVK